MFDFDSVREIFATIKKNKLRTFLTGVSIAWGIFMLILLLGIGNGFQNGVTSNFADRAQNSIQLWPGWVSMPYNGLPANRAIKFDAKDYDLIRNKLPNVEYVSVSIRKSVTISYEKEYGIWDLEGVAPDVAKINTIPLEKDGGRFINMLDIQSKRKVIVISTEMQDILFKETNPLGKYVTVGDLAFQVIGIYKDKKGRNNPPAYTSFTTAQSLYNQGYGFGMIEFTVTGLNTEKANENYEKMVREKMGALHGFNPEDRSALYVRNTAADSLQAQQIFLAIKLFILVIGLASLMAGIVGVGNIMIITVKERTKEIGIRKALGASPISVLRLIIMESLFITSLFGFVGMMAGIGLTELLAMGLASGGASDGPTLFLDPTVDVWVVLSATGLLIGIGVIAGIIPASKAVRISPIEAMRAD